MKKPIALVAVIALLANLLIFTYDVQAASVAIQLNGSPRPATPAEIAALPDYLVDGASTIPARGNVSDVTSTGWLVNPDHDLAAGTHELAIIEWEPVNLPVCAKSIRVHMDTTIQRLGIEISGNVDSLEWAHALVLGTPDSPEPADLATSVPAGMYLGPAGGGSNPYGEDVPADDPNDYTISNDKSSIDTTALARADLQGDFFSFLYFDTVSPGPQNVSWSAQLNSATVTYDDSDCNQSPNNDNKDSDDKPVATLANTGTNQTTLAVLSATAILLGTMSAFVYRIRRALS